VLKNSFLQHRVSLRKTCWRSCSLMLRTSRCCSELLWNGSIASRKPLCKAAGRRAFPVGVAVRKQKRRSLHTALGAPHVEASALAASQVGGIRRAENPQPDSTPAEEATPTSHPGVGLCCQPGSCLMPARPTEKNKCSGCVSVYHDRCADTHVGAALDIPQDLRNCFRVCSPKCWRLAC
jgi:hypothetical protein